MYSRLALLLTLPIALAACDDQAPSVTESILGTDVARDPLTAKTQGLFRIESPMLPFYSRTEPIGSVGGYGYHTDAWAAVVFYREPDCVPAGFDLFQFYDVPGAFGCTPTIDGFALHVEPLGVTPPKISQLNGDAVPIWFVPWSTFQAAIADQVLTMAELESLPGLVKGVATHFREHLTTIENHPAPMIDITARGETADGRSFRYTVTWPGLTVADVKHVSIVID